MSILSLKEMFVFGSTLLIGKLNGNTKIDFNGIAQGHSVDIIGCYLLSLGINNFMVEVGGEVLCKGVNNKNTYLANRSG